jgi:hypothetical protein
MVIPSDSIMIMYAPASGQRRPRSVAQPTAQVPSCSSSSGVVAAPAPNWIPTSGFALRARKRLAEVWRTRTVSSHLHVGDRWGEGAADEAAIARQKRVLGLTRGVASDDLGGDDEPRKPRSSQEARHGGARGDSQRGDRKLGAARHGEQRRGIARRDRADEQPLGIRADAATAHRLRPRQVRGNVIGLDLSDALEAGTGPRQLNIET